MYICISKCDANLLGIGATFPNIILFQEWETKCFCGKRLRGPEHCCVETDDPWIVNIFEVNKNFNLIQSNSRIKVILPVCLGSLISHYHVLTSRLCFGSVDGRGTFRMKWSLEHILENIRVMLGSDKWYSENFPHSIDPVINLGFNNLADFKRKAGGVLTELIDIKTNGIDDFCLLTLKDYIQFKPNISPLCLPTNPNSAYNERVVEAEIYGFGLDDSAHQTVGYLAHWERWYSQNQGKNWAEDHIGKIQVRDTPLISRRRCLAQFGVNGKLRGKNGDPDLDLSSMYDLHFT